MRRRLAELGAWSRGQQVVRAVVALGPVVALLAAAPAGTAPPVWLAAVTLLLGVVAALAPATSAPAVVLLVVAAWWARADDPLHPAVLVAAVTFAAVHVAALLAELAPPEAVLDPALVRRWVLRGALVVGVAPLVWGAALLLDGRTAPGGLWPAALAAALVAVVAVTVAIRPPEEVEV